MKHKNHAMTFLFLALFIPSTLFAQTSKRDSLWMILQPFVGNWKGQGTGAPGNGNYERSYQFILNKRFIEIRNRSTYPPTDKFPKGEVHEDIGYFSYDGGRKVFVLRQFHAEGFVNQYKLDSISPDKKTLVFISEAIENIPSGYRAKETYRLLNENEIEEIFEIAAPGKDFEIYTRVKLIRQK